MEHRTDYSVGRPALSGFVDTLKQALRAEAHTLEEIRDGLDDIEQGNTDLLRLFERHHDFIEESCSVLLNTEANELEKRDHLIRFLCLLQMHGLAEEETLYLTLRESDGRLARMEGMAGQTEHDFAFQLEDELLDAGADVIWTEEIEAKVKVMATAVMNHIREEERTMFPIAKNTLGEEALNQLVGAYVGKCKTYLDRSAREDFSQQSMAQ